MLDLTPVYYTGALGLIILGLTGIVLSRHVLRIIFSIALLESGVNLLLLLATYRDGAQAPIMVNGVFPAQMADPVPQALVLTAIVIGVGILALALSLTLRLQSRYGTLDMGDLRRAMDKDIALAADIDMQTSDHAPASRKPDDALQQISHGETAP